MKTSVCGVCCLVLLWVSRVEALADAGYYEALARAEAAERTSDPNAALQAFETMARAYPRDYTVSLHLGWAHFRLRQYAEAERAYRNASDLSDGAAVALIGLAWALIQQDRCDEAVPTITRALAHPSAQGEIHERADAALAVCRDNDAIHGSFWVVAGGSDYYLHPWKRRSGDLSAGLSLAPYRWLRVGGAYRFVRLQATDSRVAGYDQHEVYLQAGYAEQSFEWLAHAAFLGNGADALGASQHIGLSGRVRSFGAFIGELSASFYRDLWVARFAPAWEFRIGALSLTPGLALQVLAHETLAAASLLVSVALDRLSLWSGLRLGSEYRAAYLSSFSVFNAEERSAWGAWAGVRVHVAGPIALLATYSFNRLKSADGLLSDLHSVSVGSVYSL